MAAAPENKMPKASIGFPIQTEKLKATTGGYNDKK